MSSNIVTAAFGASRSARTRALHQWDYGQILQFAGLDLPNAYTVHFSNAGVGGEAKTMIGNADGVDIPDEYLTTGQPVYAWVFLHAGEDDGETVYSVIIPVTARPRPTEDAPTPQQQGLIDQAIAALNAGVQAAQDAAESVQDMSVEAETLPPGSPLNVEKTIDPETGAVTLTFYLAPGWDGVSPIIAVEEITGGHRVTITDAQGTRSFDVRNGTNGDDGRGIASAVMNADYTLTLTYTDGTSYTTPSLRGADGYSPVASVSKSGKVVTISITDRQGTTTATVRDGEDGTPGVGIPAGGTAGQVLSKVDGVDYNTAWTDKDPVITVTGTTPSITALPGIRYVCGEVTTIDITLPDSGIVDVVFESGATATVLTITPPTGVTLKWANGWDGVCEANTTYEINVCDGLGVAASWT